MASAHIRASNIKAVRKYQQKNPDKVQEWNRIGVLRQHGLTVQEYEGMLAAQNGRCGICGCLPSKRRLAVDHNHKTEEVRGLLCRECNRALGIMKDDPERLRLAADYLELHRATIGRKGPAKARTHPKEG